MTPNKYQAPCGACGAVVAPHAGYVYRGRHRWIVRHLSCTDRPSVMTIRTNSGTYTRNSNGRCEDAPCCGCCTI